MPLSNRGHTEGDHGERQVVVCAQSGVTAVITATACASSRRRGPRRYPCSPRERYPRRAARGTDRHDAESRVAAVAALVSHPGGAFGSCRYKLKSLELRDRARYERLIEVFRARHPLVLYNGGNDSADTALKISRIAPVIRRIGVPKTVDNDLAVTVDTCPGFGSVAKH